MTVLRVSFLGIGQKSPDSLGPPQVNTRTLCAVQRFQCYYCKQTMALPAHQWAAQQDNHATLEHLLPRSEGGTYDAHNIRAACRLCNTLRGTKHLSWFKEFIEDLRQRTTLINRWHQLLPIERHLVFQVCNLRYNSWDHDRKDRARHTLRNQPG